MVFRKYKTCSHNITVLCAEAGNDYLFGLAHVYRASQVKTGTTLIFIRCLNFQHRIFPVRCHHFFLHEPLEECMQSPVGSMDTPWIMFLAEGEKVASQEIWRNLLDECRRVCIAIFNGSPQELSIELECVSG